MRPLFYAFITLILISCENNATIDLSVTVKGAIEGAPVYVQKINDQDQPFTVDTLEVRGGKIITQLKKSKNPELALLHFPRIGGNFLFFIENKDITGDINIISNQYMFEGGNENNLFKEYTQKVTDFYNQRFELENQLVNAQNSQNVEEFSRLKMVAAQIINDEKSYKKMFVENNVNSMVGMMVLQELIAKREITHPDAQALLAKRGKRQPENIYTRLIQKKLASLVGTEIGNLAPDFSGPTPEGTTLSLQEVVSSSKVTLIDFWASWCRPCRIENPNVVRVHNKYKDQGFNIISVSLDRSDFRDRWLQAIKDDQMNWYHISHLLHWNEPIARQYNVRAIPATFLVDNNGVIVAKNLRGDALDRAVGTFINQ